MFRVYGCVFCSMYLLFVYICVRMPLSSRSIAGVPSGRALLGFPGARQADYCTPPVTVPAVHGGLAVRHYNNNQKKCGQ